MLASSYDDAEPTASSIAASNLQRLAHLAPGKLQSKTLLANGRYTAISPWKIGA